MRKVKIPRGKRRRVRGETEKVSVSEGENGREGGKLSWKLNDNRKLFKFVMSRQGSTKSFFLIVSMMMYYITLFSY